MKTAKRSELVNRHLIKAWLVAGAVVLCAPVASRAINSVAPGTGGVAQDAAVAPTAPAARFSPGIADIVRLVDAKVDAEVIKTYVRNSPTAYNPSATEIIALKNRGVGPEILTAMLQRGAEVRAHSMRAGQAASITVAPQPYAGAANPYAPAPGYDYSAQPVYPNYTYSYPAYTYDYPPYAYAYSGYNCGYSWPCFWPYLSFGFGCYPYGGYCGYRYPYWYGGHAYYGGRGYHANGGYYGHGARPVPYASHSGGGHSFGSGGRPAAFSGASGAFHAGGGFSGHAVSFASHGGSVGGHAGGRGR